MASKYWLKLYYEIIDDYKMGKLSRSLRYRVIEMFCLAGEAGEDGYLPSLESMAWDLRENPEQLESDLVELGKVGILDQRDGRWFVVNFAKRQKASDAAERMREYRKRNRYDDVTRRNRRYAPDKEEDTDTEAEEEPAPPATFPSTPLEASKHPDIKIFHKVSGVIPGRKDYAAVIDAFTYLRQKRPEEDLQAYLAPFWIAWSSRRSQTTGKSYSRTSVAWLTEWAVNGQIPEFPKNGNAPPQNPTAINYTALRLEQEQQGKPK